MLLIKETKPSSKKFIFVYYNVKWIYIVTWSSTERRVIRNSPDHSVFELTGRQRFTVNRGIMTVGQFLAAEVTNPGQNESQQMFTLCDRMDKEGDIQSSV